MISNEEELFMKQQIELHATRCQYPLILLPYGRQYFFLGFEPFLEIGQRSMKSPQYTHQGNNKLP